MGTHDVSIHAPRGANLEEVIPPPNELYPPEGGCFKPKRVFDKFNIDLFKRLPSTYRLKFV